MNVIDILILAALAVSVIFGMYRGFISGVLSVAALIGAAAAAFAISPSLATWLQGNETLVNTLMYYTDAGSTSKTSIYRCSPWRRPARAPSRRSSAARSCPSSFRRRLSTR